MRHGVMRDGVMRASTGKPSDCQGSQNRIGQVIGVTVDISFLGFRSGGEMSNPPQFIASYFTLAGKVDLQGGALISPHDLRERAEAASLAGYVGMGFITDDLCASLDRHGVS